MPARGVIINADDLGLWPSVDRGILEARAQKAVGDSSMFANAPAPASVLRAAAAAGLPVGVHLNLTFGRPVSDPAAIPDLVTADGLFMKRQQWTSPLPAAQVRTELAAQVQRLVDFGARPSHLDSHHHVHGYPEILPVVIELARAWRLPVRAVSPEMREALRVASVAAPDDFAMTFYGERAMVETLMALVEACPGGVLEIMTHPGYADANLPSSYGSERERELRALADPRWREYLAARHIPLLGFADLASWR